MFGLKIKKTDINYGKILRKHGLGPDGRARIFLANEVARMSDPYVPMDTGVLKNTREIAPDGRRITYPQPYAHYQYKGLSKSGKPLHYGGGPLRGKEWDKRMMADHGKQIESSFAKYVGGRPK